MEVGAAEASLFLRSAEADVNLHGIVSGAIDAVNPRIPAGVQVSNGYTTGADGKRTPAFLPTVNVYAQVQALTFRDIVQLDGLNLQGTRRAIYLFGQVNGLVRSANEGGDLITIATGGTSDGVWLVAMILEQWPDWCKAACTLQDNA